MTVSLSKFSSYKRTRQRFTVTNLAHFIKTAITASADVSVLMTIPSKRAFPGLHSPTTCMVVQSQKSKVGHIPRDMVTIQVFPRFFRNFISSIVLELLVVQRCLSRGFDDLKFCARWYACIVHLSSSAAEKDVIQDLGNGIFSAKI